MNKIIYQQLFTDPAYHPLGSRSIRAMVFSDGLVQFCDADEDDDLLCSCTINDISKLAEAHTENLIGAPAKNNKALKTDRLIRGDCITLCDLEPGQQICAGCNKYTPAA